MVRPFVVNGSNGYFALSLRKFKQIAETARATTCNPLRDRLASLLHRARSESRSQLLLGVLGGSRRFPGVVDGSATGSVNFFGPATPPTRLCRIAPDAPPPPRLRPRHHVVPLGPVLRALHLDRRQLCRLRQRRDVHRRRRRRVSLLLLYPRLRGRRAAASVRVRKREHEDAREVVAELLTEPRVGVRAPDVDLA